LTTYRGPFVVVNVYRPGSERPTSRFFDELSTVLETLVILSCPVVVGGDFNIAAQDLGDHNARRLAELLTSFDMTQHVSEPTQIHGNTLDLVVTPTDLQPVTVDVEPAGMFSDHALVVCRLPLDVEPVSWPVHTCFRNRINCIPKQKLCPLKQKISIPKQDKLYPETETLSPETETFYPETG